MSMNIPPDTGLTENDFNVEKDGTRALSLRRPEQAALLVRDDVLFDLLILSVGFENFEPLVPYAHRVKALSTFGNPSAEGLVQLQALERLRSFSLKFDYRQLPNLIRFDTRDASVIPAKFLNHPNIERLDVAECRIEKLTALGDMARLRQLRLVATKTKSLDGVERLPALRELRLYHARALVDISALAACADLRIFTVEDSKKLADISAIRGLRQLQLLMVYSSQARLTDIDWLADMPHLRCLVLGAGVDKIDWGVVARHPTLYDIFFCATPESLVQSDDVIREHCRAAGRAVTSIQRYPKMPGIRVQLEPPAGLEKPLSILHYQHQLNLHELPAP